MVILKLVLVLGLFFSVMSLSAQEMDELDWVTDFDTAKLISAQQKKPILMYFTGSDWCPPCKLLKKEFFNTSQFKERSENVVLMMVDIPRRRDLLSAAQLSANKQLVVKYNKEGSFPLLVAMNSNGKVINEISAYSGKPAFHFQFVDKVIKNY